MVNVVNVGIDGINLVNVHINLVNVVVNIGVNVVQYADVRYIGFGSSTAGPRQGEQQ
ncbi:hypothetical protein Lesp01_79530 [Lentzea sp. NBRC 102530]|nr:hypothetical protein Lesp01_79530 [Lentzea sp. NBRC 102530]